MGTQNLPWFVSTAVTLGERKKKEKKIKKRQKVSMRVKPGDGVIPDMEYNVLPSIHPDMAEQTVKEININASTFLLNE